MSPASTDQSAAGHLLCSKCPGRCMVRTEPCLSSRALMSKRAIVARAAVTRCPCSTSSPAAHLEVAELSRSGVGTKLWHFLTSSQGPASGQGPKGDDGEEKEGDFHMWGRRWAGQERSGPWRQHTVDQELKREPSWEFRENLVFTFVHCSSCGMSGEKSFDYH